MCYVVGEKSLTEVPGRLLRENGAENIVENLLKTVSQTKGSGSKRAVNYEQKKM